MVDSVTSRRSICVAALAANDLMGFDRNRHLGSEREFPRGRIIAASEMRDLFPFLHRGDSTSGALWYDAQVQDSERLTLSVLLAAADRGAALANYAGVQHLLGGERRRVRRSRPGSVYGADLRSARTYGARCHGPLRVYACASTPGRGPLGPRPVRSWPRRSIWWFEGPRWAPHWVYSRRTRATAIRGVGVGRFLFIVPWRNRTLISTWYPPLRIQTGAGHGTGRRYSGRAGSPRSGPSVQPGMSRAGALARRRNMVSSRISSIRTRQNLERRKVSPGAVE